MDLMQAQQILIVVWLTAMLVMVFILYQRGKEALSIFPDLSSVKVLFREKGVSGYSEKSWLTKLGNANNVLEVILTNRELWVRSPVIFAGFLKTFDLLHKVELKQVTVVKAEHSKLELGVRTKDGIERIIHLRMKKVSEFFIAFQYASQGTAFKV